MNKKLSDILSFAIVICFTVIFVDITFILISKFPRPSTIAFSIGSVLLLWYVYLIKKQPND